MDNENCARLLTYNWQGSNVCETETQMFRAWNACHEKEVTDKACGSPRCVWSRFWRVCRVIAIVGPISLCAVAHTACDCAIAATGCAPPMKSIYPKYKHSASTCPSPAVPRLPASDSRSEIPNPTKKQLKPLGSVLMICSTRYRIMLTTQTYERSRISIQKFRRTIRSGHRYSC